MISAVNSFAFLCVVSSFSAIARSVMISAPRRHGKYDAFRCFSAIARSVMISAGTADDDKVFGYRFSAIARSVMISACASAADGGKRLVEVSVL